MQIDNKMQELKWHLWLLNLLSQLFHHFTHLQLLNNSVKVSNYTVFFINYTFLFWCPNFFIQLCWIWFISFRKLFYFKLILSWHCNDFLRKYAESQQCCQDLSFLRLIFSFNNSDENWRPISSKEFMRNSFL